MAVEVDEGKWIELDTVRHDTHSLYERWRRDVCRSFQFSHWILSTWNHSLLKISLYGNGTSLY